MEKVLVKDYNQMFMNNGTHNGEMTNIILPETMIFIKIIRT